LNLRDIDFKNIEQSLPKVKVPSGRIGLWEINRFTLSASEARDENRRQRPICGGQARYVKPGTYTRLVRNHSDEKPDGALVMSDTPAECDENKEAVDRAAGHCLVHGLGIGVVINAMLLRDEVTKVTVIEKSQEVIDLVGPYYMDKFGDRLEIICADAHEWKSPRGMKYGVVWHDIWDSISADNWPSMKKLTRRYQNKCGWQGCWCKDLSYEQVEYERGYRQEPGYIPAWVLGGLG